MHARGVRPRADFAVRGEEPPVAEVHGRRDSAGLLQTARLHAEDTAVADVLAVVWRVAARALDRAALAVLQQERAVVLEVAVDRGLLVIGWLHLVPEAKVTRLKAGEQSTYTKCIGNGFTHDDHVSSGLVLKMWSGKMFS